MGTQDLLSLFKINLLKNFRVWLLVTIWFFLLVYYSKNLPQDFKDFLLNPFNIIVLPFSILTAILFRELSEELSNLEKRGKKYSFTVKSWNNEWIYNGKTRLLLEPVRLRVNSSRAGCLLKKYLWKNFKMSFQFRFLSKETVNPYYEYVGLVFRARDLENYLMLEMIQRNSEFFIKPHVRYLGMWETMSEEKISDEAKTPTDWQDVQLIVNGNEVRLLIEDVGEYEWFLPTHIDINHIEDGPRKNNSPEFDEKEFVAKTTLLPEIEFRESFGMIGFRAHLNQGAEIKDLTVYTLENKG